MSILSARIHKSRSPAKEGWLVRLGKDGIQVNQLVQ